ncbi:GAF domain nucleotide-binding protein [Rhodofomes roseus]|uniref:GAF domain nucleotide-binding protein n=1 Tax=Rhodofomes roseus TaxID=34475 RepID=A0ABQ8KLI1_9APHY|nr:GAF domain nucleotide-binding protein [Rhodofomes roseus]KAH9839130.1 GAF domain nucleotide-binding protein [Rhodofomes roseus]
MPHADSALVPSGVDKAAFWTHVHEQLSYLLDGQRNWVTNLANAASLIYNSLAAFEPHFGSGERAVNWCGFYMESNLFPSPQIFRAQTGANKEHEVPDRLLLGPFCGKPACQFIDTAPGKARGVCADAYIAGKTVLVADVDAYPGHIACDGETKSEIVCPLVLRKDGGEAALGVLDLDCLVLGGFTSEDQQGLERIAQLVLDSCDW